MGEYLAGTTTARTADEMSSPALLLLGLAVTSSAQTASLLYAGLTISAAAGGPVLGALLDRSARPGRLLAYTLGGYAAGLAVIAVGLGHAPTGAVVAVAVLAGFLAPSLSGGWTSRLPDVLPPDRISRGYSLDAATFSAAALAGPALAGLVAAAAGATWAMAVVTALLLLAAPAAWRLPGGALRSRSADMALASAGGGSARQGSTSGGSTSEDSAGRDSAGRGRTGQGSAGQGSAGQGSDGEDSAGEGSAGGLVADLQAGFGAIARSRRLLRITVCSVVAYLGVGMLVVACPLIGERHLGGADRGALLLSVIAATSLATTAAMSRWPPRLSPDAIFAVATALAGCAYAALALAPDPAWIIVAVAVVGVADGPQLAAVFAVRYQQAPRRLRGQVFTTAASLKISAGAIGATLAGQLAARSPALLLATAAATQAAALAGFALTSLTRRKDSPPQTAPATEAGPASH
jgi:MFS family permease